MARSTSLRLCIGLVYYDKTRYRHIRSGLNRLKRNLSGKFNIEIIEEGEQPKVVGHPISAVMVRKYRLWKLNREWIRYKNMNPRNIVLDLLILARRLILTVINKDEECHRAVIDSYVTDKHLRLWSRFLETKFDFLICFEDDAVFKEDSISRLKKFLSGIANYKGKFVYLDLAGGVSQELLKVKSLEVKRFNDRIYYKKPVTNTACCYLVGRDSVTNFFYHLLRNPGLRLISIDWLLNKLFILSIPDHKYLCYHAEPSIFSHGSVSGKYSSWL